MAFHPLTIHNKPPTPVVARLLLLLLCIRHGWLKEQIRGSVVSKPAVGAIPADRFDKPERKLLDNGPASWQYSHPSEFRWVLFTMYDTSTRPGRSTACMHAFLGLGGRTPMIQGP